MADGAARPRPGWTEIALGVVGYAAVTVVAVIVLVGSVIPGSRSGSVWPGVVAHGVNNAIVFGAAAVLLS